MTDKERYNLCQQQRSDAERNLPFWQIQALDEARRSEALNIIENPALWSKLREIEAKLDMVLALLQHHANPDEQKTDHHS